MADFDLKTHIRDPKSGRVIASNPYVLRIKNGERVYERGGKRYYENGEEVKTPQQIAAEKAAEVKLEGASDTKVDPKKTTQRL